MKIHHAIGCSTMHMQNGCDLSGAVPMRLQRTLSRSVLKVIDESTSCLNCEFSTKTRKSLNFQQDCQKKMFNLSQQDNDQGACHEHGRGCAMGDE